MPSDPTKLLIVFTTIYKITFFLVFGILLLKNLYTYYSRV